MTCKKCGHKAEDHALVIICNLGDCTADCMSDALSDDVTEEMLKENGMR